MAIIQPNTPYKVNTISYLSKVTDGLLMINLKHQSWIPIARQLMGARIIIFTN